MDGGCGAAQPQRSALPRHEHNLNSNCCCTWSVLKNIVAVRSPGHCSARTPINPLKVTKSAWP